MSERNLAKIVEENLKLKTASDVIKIKNLLHLPTSSDYLDTVLTHYRGLMDQDQLDDAFKYLISGIAKVRELAENEGSLSEGLKDFCQAICRIASSGRRR